MKYKLNYKSKLVSYRNELNYFQLYNAIFFCIAKLYT